MFSVCFAVITLVNVGFVCIYFEFTLLSHTWWTQNGFNSAHREHENALNTCMCRSLLIFSYVTFKVVAWWPYWIFWFPASNKFGFENVLQTSVAHYLCVWIEVCWFSAMSFSKWLPGGRIGFLYPPYPKDRGMLWFYVEAARRPPPAARRPPPAARRPPPAARRPPPAARRPPPAARRPPPAAHNGVNAITQKPQDGLFSNLVYTLVVIVSWPD